VAEEPATALRQARNANYQLAFSPDGRFLAAAGAGALVHLWDLACGARHEAIRPGPRAVTALAFSPDSRVLALRCSDRIVRLLDPSTGQVRASFPGPEKVFALAFSPDGLALALGGRHEMEVWERKGEEAPWGLAFSRAAGVRAACFSPRGDCLALSLWSGPLCLLDAHRRGREYPPCWQRQPRSRASSLAFTPEGETLLTISRDELRCRDVDTGSALPTGRADFYQWDEWDEKARYRNLRETGENFDAEELLELVSQRWVFSDDAAWLARPLGRVVLLRDISDAPRETRLEWDPGEPLTCLAFSPDGKTLATGGERGTVKLWPWRLLLEA
jgi:WD40 repeat protein